MSEFVPRGCRSRLSRRTRLVFEDNPGCPRAAWRFLTCRWPWPKLDHRISTCRTTTFHMRLSSLPAVFLYTSALYLHLHQTTSRSSFHLHRTKPNGSCGPLTMNPELETGINSTSRYFTLISIDFRNCIVRVLSRQRIVVQVLKVDFSSSRHDANEIMSIIQLSLPNISHRAWSC